MHVGFTFILSVPKDKDTCFGSIRVMKHLVQRALDVYREQGAISAASKSARYATRAVVHRLGKKWLYGDPHYRSLSTWMNAGMGSYTAVADPLEVYRIDPEAITYITGRGPNPGRFQWQQLGTICGGNWDRPNEKFTDLELHSGLYDRFHNGLPWEETDFAHRVPDQAANGTADWKNVRSERDLRRAFERVDALYESIDENGYRTMTELVDAGVVDPRTHRLPEPLVRRDEVTVDIGRDGQFLFVDGRHRLAIAKILDLEMIPVRISARHTQWQRIRELAAATAPDKQLPEPVARHRDHPDLADIFASDRTERA